MLNNGFDMLYKILEVGEKSRNMKAIGLYCSSVNKKVKSATKKFVSPKKKIEFVIEDHMSQHPAQHVYPHNHHKFHYSPLTSLRNGYAFLFACSYH